MFWFQAFNGLVWVTVTVCHNMQTAKRVADRDTSETKRIVDAVTGDVFSV